MDKLTGRRPLSQERDLLRAFALDIAQGLGRTLTEAELVGVAITLRIMCELAERRVMEGHERPS